MGSVLKTVGGVAGTAFGGPVGGAIGSSLGGIVGGALGGGSSEKSSSTTDSTARNILAGPTYAEQQRQQLMDRQIAAGLGAQGAAADQALAGQQELGGLFRQALVELSAGQGASPEQIAQATSFIDETFTKPANLALDRSLQEFGEQQQATAAALGRQPTDIGFQEELFQNVVRGQQDIQAQRGALIQGRADELSFNRPMQVAGMLGEGSRFFNTQASNLFNNQANLLNIATQQQAQGLRAREAGKTVQQISGTQSTEREQAGLGARIEAIGSGLGNLGSAFKEQFPKTFGDGE